VRPLYLIVHFEKISQHLLDVWLGSEADSSAQKEEIGILSLILQNTKTKNLENKI